MFYMNFSSVIPWLSCLLLVSFNLFAGPGSDKPATVNTEAGESSIISEAELLQQIVPASCHFSGQFIQRKHIQGLPVPLQSNGDFFFSCDFGLVWNTLAPIQEALLYVNARKNYRVDERGDIEPLSGAARYAMSKIFLRLLKGDTEYFADEFEVAEGPQNEGLSLTPESEFMKKGIRRILIEKRAAENAGVTLNISIEDTTGQNTNVTIDGINEYDIENKQAAFEQCEVLYPGPRQWCRVLRSPDFYMR